MCWPSSTRREDRAGIALLLVAGDGRNRGADPRPRQLRGHHRRSLARGCSPCGRHAGVVSTAHPLFKASVSINLVVRIGTGWLGVDINCSFYAEISEQFTIPVNNPGLPAWTMPPKNGTQGAPQAPAPFGLMAQSGGMEEALLSLVSFGLADPGAGAAAASGCASEGRFDAAGIATDPQNDLEPYRPSREQRGDLRLLFRPQFTMAR